MCFQILVTYFRWVLLRLRTTYALNWVAVKAANLNKCADSRNYAYTQPTHLIFGVIKDADHIYYCIKNQVRRRRYGNYAKKIHKKWSFYQKISQKWAYLRLHTTHKLDFWYCNRYGPHLLSHQKLGGWVVCRRSFGSLTTHSRLFGIGCFYQDSLNFGFGEGYWQYFRSTSKKAQNSRIFYNLFFSKFSRNYLLQCVSICQPRF